MLYLPFNAKGHVCRVRIIKVPTEVMQPATNVAADATTTARGGGGSADAAADALAAAVSMAAAGAVGAAVREAVGQRHRAHSSKAAEGVGSM